MDAATVLHREMRFALQSARDALRCAALRCAALRCAALRCAALRCAALRCCAVQCTVERCALRCISRISHAGTDLRCRDPLHLWDALQTDLRSAASLPAADGSSIRCSNEVPLVFALLLSEHSSWEICCISAERRSLQLIERLERTAASLQAAEKVRETQSLSRKRVRLELSKNSSQYISFDWVTLF